MHRVLQAQVRNSRRIHYDASSRVPFAFAFDIDGVLLRGSRVLPAAQRALAFLNGKNPKGIRVPYILMTNGGGQTELERCRKLSAMGLQVQPSQFIQASTLLRGEAFKKYARAPVLVLGGALDKGREIAHSYGYQQVYIPLDILAWNPDIWPFHKITPEERGVVKSIDFAKTPIESILVFHDPLNWSLDIQIMTDILRLGSKTTSAYGLSGSKEGGDRVDLVFCNPDLLWRGAFDVPRLGQGGFKQAFQGIYKALTGSYYPYTQFGKPTKETYQFGEEMLRKQLTSSEPTPPDTLPTIYMVGDNPESDIAGANAAGWRSILVRTGVYSPSDGPPSHRPTVELEDVEMAVQWVCEQENLLPSGW